jgi:hypothetical protein
MRPPVLCALLDGASGKKRIAQNTKNADLARTPACNFSQQTERTALITHPLRQNISFLNQFFEVAAFPEPYYNPANLEKAAISVK